MLKFVVLAVAVTVAGPSYSGSVDDREIARHSERSDTTEQEALATLIERHWVEGEARERGITETETNATLRTELLQAAINAQIAEPAAKSVTPDQVKAYVDANPQTLPPARRARVIDTKSRAEARRVLRRLKAGATWASLGGETAEADADEDTRIARALFRADLNETTRYGKVVFRVIQHRPGRPVPRAQQEAMAWELLAGQAQERALADFRAQFTAKWRQRTSCAPRYASHAACGPPPSGQHTP